jgi:hypothetical protein
MICFCFLRRIRESEKVEYGFICVLWMHSHSGFVMVDLKPFRFTAIFDDRREIEMLSENYARRSFIQKFSSNARSRDFIGTCMDY